MRTLFLLEIEDGGQATIDELVVVNLGTEEEPSALLPEDQLKTLLLEFTDCFRLDVQGDEISSFIRKRREARSC